MQNKMFRFSDRFEELDFDHGETDLAQSLRSVHEAGNTVFDLTQSNPTTADFTYATDTILSAIASESAMEYNPDSAGLLSAREAIAAYYGDRGWRCNADQLILTSGTSEAYAFLFKLLCNPEEQVLVPAPGYPLFDFVAMVEKVRVESYPLSEEAGRWSIDLATLEELIGPKTRAIIVVQPNNPTGNVATHSEIDAIFRMAAENNLAVIVDEVFSDYCFAPSRFRPFKSENALIFTLNGFSKLLGLPQMKLAWIRIDGAASLIKEARERLEVIADTFLSVNTPIQVGAPALLAGRAQIQKQIQDRIHTNLAALRGMLRGGAEFGFKEPDGGWYAVLEFSDALSDEKFALSALREKQVYIHPGRMFGLDGGCRQVVSLLTPVDEFRQGIERLNELARMQLNK
jgi:alanine-synthesizing transaminase